MPKLLHENELCPYCFEVRTGGIVHNTPTVGGGYSIAGDSTLCATAGADYKIDAVFTSWPSHRVDWDGVNNRFVFTGEDGKAVGTVVATGAVDGGCTMSYNMFLNGVKVDGLQSTHTYQNATETATLSGTGVISFTDGDYLEFFVSSDTAGRTAITTELTFSVG